MGLAWVDDLPPDSTEPALRSGGLPLLPVAARWPACPVCGLALLFRAQVPLALTSLVPFDDPRLLLVFECYAVHDDGACAGAAALLVAEPLIPRLAPASERSPTVLGRVYGGRLVPFDDGPEAAFRTTLPPLDRVARRREAGGLRGLLGGSFPGCRDEVAPCRCSRPTRTAVRLLAARERDPESGITLREAVAQVCLPCRIATVRRGT